MMCGLLEIAVSEDQSFAPFLDLGPDDLGDLYPHEFVGAAYQAGVTKGTTTTTFSPYTNITLAQVVTMVVRAADAYHPGLLANTLGLTGTGGGQMATPRMEPTSAGPITRTCSPSFPSRSPGPMSGGPPPGVRLARFWSISEISLND